MITMKQDGVDVSSRFFTDYHDYDEVITYLNSCGGNTGGQYDEDMKFRVKISIDRLNLELILIYKKDHSVDRLLHTKGSGEDLTLLIGYMIHELMGNHETDVANLVLYSHGIPVKGYYRNSKLGIQISPLPEDYPTAKYSNQPHPFLVQVRYTKTRKVWLNSTRRDKICRLVKFTLSSCLNTTISFPTEQLRWGVENEPSADHNPISFMDSYWINDLEADENGFLPVADLSEMAMIHPHSYIPQNAFTFEHSLELPSNLEDILKIVSGLPKNLQSKYLRAGYWTAQSAIAASSSLQYLCLSLALESLLPNPEKTNFCSSCQRESDKPIPESVGNSLKKFLVDYAGIPEDQVTKYKGKLYGLRSAIAHGDHIFEMDDHFQIGLSSQQIEEGDSYRSLKIIARVAMYNWLIRHH